MTTMAFIIFAAAASTASAFISIDTSPFFFTDLRSSGLDELWRAPSASPSWRCTDAKCSISYPVSHLAADSLHLTLGDDGKTVTLSGERNIEGCTCKPRDEVMILLPFTPSSPQALQSSIDRAERLSITLSKHAKMPEPVAISIKKPEPEASQLRFVPHESAAAASTGAKEMMEEAFDKFRAVAALAKKDEADSSSSDVSNVTDQVNEAASDVTETPADANETANRPAE